MIAPVERLKKQEIVWLKTHYCKHKHTYLAHYNCFTDEVGSNERLGFLDIETSGLKADFHYIYSWSVLGSDNKIKSRVLTPEEIRSGIFDRELLKEFAEEAHRYDRFITYCGTYFDIPFLRTRAVYWNIDFPTFNTIKHTDLYWTIKKKFRLSRRKLGIACEFFGIEAKTHPMTPEIWWKAGTGDPTALKFILTHNEEDVVSTKKLYERVINYDKISDTSI